MRFMTIYKPGDGEVEIRQMQDNPGYPSPQ